MVDAGGSGEDRVEKQLTEQRRQVECSEVPNLLAALEQRREDAAVKRMMPSYVRSFFDKAAPHAGVGIAGDLGGVFFFDPCPDTVRRAMQTYPDEIQDRLTFSRELAMPPDALAPRAIYLHPGEPVAAAPQGGRLEGGAGQRSQAEGLRAGAGESRRATLVRRVVPADGVGQPAHGTGDAVRHGARPAAARRPDGSPPRRPGRDDRGAGHARARGEARSLRGGCLGPDEEDGLRSSVPPAGRRGPLHRGEGPRPSWRNRAHRERVGPGPELPALRIRQSSGSRRATATTTSTCCSSTAACAAWSPSTSSWASSSPTTPGSSAST